MNNKTSHFLFSIGILLTTILTGCFSEPPGVGKPSDYIRYRSKIIISAIDQYFVENKGYPQDLDILVPNYLPPNSNDLTSKDAEEYRINYNSHSGKLFDYSFDNDENGPVIKARYFGPGSNMGLYSFKQKQWQWSGYY